MQIKLLTKTEPMIAVVVTKMPELGFLGTRRDFRQLQLA